MTALPITQELTLTELERGIVVRVNSLPPMVRVPGDQPPLPEKLAIKPNVFVLDTEFFPVVGDVVTINEKEFQLVDIDEGVATLKRGDEIRYYSFCDIEHDIMKIGRAHV